MKTIFTFLLSLLFLTVNAQDQVFTHKADPGNSSFNVTYIDHPLLNGNPGANFILTHNLHVNGTQYNNKVSGTWYDGASWTVYNEDVSNIVDGSAYNIYVPNGADLISVQADGTSYETVINDASINNNPNAILVYSTYYNPASVYNDNNYGFYYNTTTNRWYIYNEATATNAPANATFEILIGAGTGGATTFIHNVTAPIGNYTIIDHPSLNGKPNAFPIVAHNWGSGGDPSNIILDTPIGVWYDGANWTIYTEDVSAMPLNARFNVYVADPALAVEDVEIEGFSMYPNPASDFVTIQAKDVISHISIYNILGQEVAQIEGDNAKMTIDISNYSSGSYFAKVQVGDAIKTVKLIKS